MEYLTANFDGNIRRWISTIVNSDKNILLCPSKPDQLGNETPSEPRAEEYGSEKLVGLFTSASTGNAKCIWNSFNNLLLNAEITGREFGISSGDKLLMMAKPWHIAGLSWMLMANKIGAEWRFISTKSGEVEKWHQAILDFNPDGLLTVPAVLAQLLRYDDWFVPKIIFGGAALKFKYNQLLSQYGNAIFHAYGQTEAGGLISYQKLMNDQQLSNDINNCVGHPPKEFAIRCKGSPGDPQPIWVNSPTTVHSSYYNTGDLGYVSNNGNLFLYGRGKGQEV